MPGNGHKLGLYPYNLEYMGILFNSDFTSKESGKLQYKPINSAYADRASILLKVIKQGEKNQVLTTLSVSDF